MFSSAKFSTLLSLNASSQPSNVTESQIFSSLLPLNAGFILILGTHLLSNALVYEGSFLATNQDFAFSEVCATISNFLSELIYVLCTEVQNVVTGSNLNALWSGSLTPETLIFLYPK